MVERKICSFCGNEIEPGTGKMFIKKDGTFFYFCANKCQKNLIILRRAPRELRWTKQFVKVKGEEVVEAEKEEAEEKVEQKKEPTEEGVEEKPEDEMEEIEEETEIKEHKEKED